MGVTVQLSPSSSSAEDVTPVSPSKNPLMEELLSVQKRRGSVPEEAPALTESAPISVSGYNPSFQDQLKSKLEARKRSMESSDEKQSRERSDHHKLPLSEVQSPSYKEPSQEGVIPPEFRTTFSGSRDTVPHKSNSFSPEQERFSGSDRRAHNSAHNWSNNPVELWSKEQVANWLLALSMEMYIPRFLDSSVDGEQLLTLDSTLLKQLGVINKSDRDKIKDKLKELKKQNDKEKRELEKERKKKEKEAKSFPKGGRR